MAQNDSANRPDDDRPKGEPGSPDKAPARPDDAGSPGQAGSDAPPPTDQRTGVTAYPPSEGPDAVEPAPQPNTVIGKEPLPEAYEADAVARKEVEARESGQGPTPGSGQGGVPRELLENPEARRAGVTRLGLVAVAILVVILLVSFLL